MDDGSGASSAAPIEDFDLLTKSVQQLDDDDLRHLLGDVVREYSLRAQRSVDGGGHAWAPLSAEGPVTATDVLITTRNMLKVFEIAPFELGFLDY